ncbi:hypothetical protein B4U80_06715 [Leptotrombidium deliense]|uniref:Uncharacterized protein n=1 Tax=Leptotrombidium deliense TaxID=299467 RepID=A0A443SGY0_9ACAR|nr:hypothetical protein B4U80_06715 [Leptotrombidium deliense]
MTVLIHRRNSIAECFNERGLFRYKTIDFAEAIDDFSKAIEYDDQMSAAYYNRGLVNYRMSLFQKAVVDFEKAVFLDVNNREFQLALNETHKALKESK